MKTDPEGVKDDEDTPQAVEVEVKEPVEENEISSDNAAGPSKTAGQEQEQASPALTPNPSTSSAPPQSSTITTNPQILEQVLGDISYTQPGVEGGDLGEAMEVAEKEGREEREAEERDEVGKKDE